VESNPEMYHKLLNFKLETKSNTSQAMQYRHGIVTRMPIMQVELLTISTVTIRSIWHNSAANVFFAFWKISAANLWILWRHLPTELRKV